MAAYIRSASASSSAASFTTAFPTDFNAGSLVCIGVSSREPISGIEESTTTIFCDSVASTQDTFGPTTWGYLSALLKTIALGSAGAITVTGATTATKSIWMDEYAGSGAGSDSDTTAIEGTSTGTNFGTAANTGVTAATTDASTVTFVVIAQEPASQNATFANVPPYTKRGDQGVLATTVSVAAKENSATGTQQETATVGGGSSIVWCALIANFKLTAAAAAEIIFPRTPPGQFARLRR